MSSPDEPTAATSESRAESKPAESGYLIANFVIGLVGLFQLCFASLGALGVFSYVTAAPSNPEAYQANVAAIAVFPMSIGVILISAFAYRAVRARVYKPVRRWFAITSFLPLLMVIASFVVPLFFDGPSMF